MNFIFSFFLFFGAVHAPTVYRLIIFPCNIALISGVLLLLPSLPNRVESKAICLIAKPSLTSTLNPLSLLFFIAVALVTVLEMAACIPPTMARPHSTCQMSFAHNYCVELSNARINWFSDDWFLLLYFLPAELSSSLCFFSFPQPFFFQKVGLPSL